MAEVDKKANGTYKHWVDILHNPYAARVILVVSIVITGVAWYVSNSYAEKRAQDRFEFQVEQAQFSIKKRMIEYEQILRGGVGLFLTQSNVTRKMWHDYVTNLQIGKFFPGIQGMGFSRVVKPEEKQRHIKQIREEGFPEYIIKPDGERAIYTAIIFLEPFDFRNKRAFGYDMFSEPTRNQAMSLARDTGEPAVSGKITLVQETDKDVQAGFLMYLPVYAREVHDIEQRRDAILGYVYSPFRTKDLMLGIQGVGIPEVKFKIYDGNEMSEKSLLFDSRLQAHGPETDSPASKKIRHTIELGGHQWTIAFESTAQFDEITATSQPLLVAFGGIIIDFFLFYVILSLAKLRRRAVEMAEAMLAEMKKRELHFKAITDTANDGIVLTDDTGNIIYFNRAAEFIFGYTKHEVFRKPITMLMPEQYRKKHSDSFFKFMDTGQSMVIGKTLELEGQRKSNEIFPIELSFSQWKTDGIHYVNAVIRDITERKKIERMKDEFISTVSHELRTPLTALTGSVNLIRSGLVGQLNQQGQELLAMASSNIGRLGRLINDILDIEKIESGVIHLNMAEHDIAALVMLSTQQMQSFADEKGVLMDINLSSGGRVLVDEDRFLQIMANLLSNAIKYSDAGKVVEVSSERINDRVRVSVIDHGPGIPDSFRDRIFQKFAQADGSDTKAKGGTGLGLSICKALVEAFGGDIGFQSIFGDGATFYFEFPLVNENDIAVQQVGR